jgi:hypothetical protein
MTACSSVHLRNWYLRNSPCGSVACASSTCANVAVPKNDSSCKLPPYKKSVGLRIGKNCSFPCSALTTSVNVISFTEVVKASKVVRVNETRYLGVYLMAGLKFACSFEKTKIKFYRASNAILSKLGKQNNPTTTVHLLLTIAFPILIHSLEALALNKITLPKT